MIMANVADVVKIETEVGIVGGVFAAAAQAARGVHEDVAPADLRGALITPIPGQAAAVAAAIGIDEAVIIGVGQTQARPSPGGKAALEASENRARMLKPARKFRPKWFQSASSPFCAPAVKGTARTAPKPISLQRERDDCMMCLACG